MKTLGIETSSSVGSAAICEDGRVIAEQSLGKGMHHGRELLPAIKSLFDSSALPPGGIDLVAVSVGPGSYTGLRVGIACARTISYVLSKPVIGVSSMDAVVQNVGDKSGCICPVIDARRKMVYASVYECAPDAQTFYFASIGNDGGRPPAGVGDTASLRPWQTTSGLLLIAPDDLAGSLPSGTAVFGDGAQRYEEIFEGRNLLPESDDLSIPRASIVALLGMIDYEGGRRCDIADLLPVYLSKPAAVTQKNEREQSED